MDAGHHFSRRRMTYAVPIPVLPPSVRVPPDPLFGCGKCSTSSTCPTKQVSHQDAKYRQGRQERISLFSWRSWRGTTLSAAWGNLSPMAIVFPYLHMLHWRGSPKQLHGVRERKTMGLRPSYHRWDRKSTRLNSRHLVISYAVFCLKK